VTTGGIKTAEIGFPNPEVQTRLGHPACDTGWFREIETTVFDPASVFLSTH